MCRPRGLLWKLRSNYFVDAEDCPPPSDRRSSAPQYTYLLRCMLRMCRAYAASKPTKSLYTSGLEATKYDGTTVPLSSLAGKVSIVVNVASR